MAISSQSLSLDFFYQLTDLHDCINTNGSFNCSCKSGYKPFILTSKEICIDIDECAAGTNNCDYNVFCLNMPGTFKCSTRFVF